MNTLLSSLRGLDLNEHESLVYASIIDGAQSPSQIDHKIRLHRPAIYKALGSLSDIGLIGSTLNGKRRTYHANNPEVLRQIADDQRESAEDAIREVSERLNAKKRASIPQFIQGRHAITTVFSDVVKTLKRGETLYRITSEKNLAYINSRLPRGYRKLRDSKNIERLVISNEASGAQKKPRLERFIRFFPKDISPFHQDIIALVYSHKAAFIDASNDTAIIIDNPALSDFLSKIFLALYKKL